MSQEPTTSSKGNILVVDDTPANLQLLTSMLSEQGYQVRVAPSGKLALRSVQLTPPDLILLDILMPEIDGYEVCSQLKASPTTKDIPVIFISALHEALDKGKAFAVGGVDYITKPFQLEEVLARIENQLRIQRLYKQLAQENARLQQQIRDKEAAVRHRQQIEKALRASALTLRYQNRVLTELSRNPALHQGDLKAALKAIVEATAQNIAVERASVWLLDSTGTYLECLDLYELSLDRHSPGVQLATTDYPAYFQALNQESLIVADDAPTDPRTREFFELYLTPLRITSMLDAPIRVGGQTVGVLCSEQVGTARHWTPEDQNFARSAAELVSLALEAQKRKYAEAALRESEEKFFKAFRSSPDPIAIATFGDGRYIDVNDSFCQLFGYSRSQVIGHTASELQIWVNPEERIQLTQVLQEEGVVRDKEFKFRTKSGELRTVLLSAEIIDVGFESCVLTVRKDITERKRIEEELRKSEERWQLVLQGNNDGLWDLNLKTGESFRSARYKEMLGYSNSEMGDSFDEWKSRIHPDDVNRVMAAQRDYLERRVQHYIIEYRLRCKDGSYKWIMSRGQAVWDERGVAVRFIGSMTDISDRKQAEAALSESEKKYRNLVEASQDIIWSLDAEGRYTFVNRAVKHIYGYDPEEMLGRLFVDFMPPQQAAKDQKVFQLLIQGEPIFQYETTHLAKDGRPIQLMLNAIAIQDSQGNILGVTGTASDITERKGVEKERNALIASLQKSEASLEAAQRIAHIGSWEFDVLTEEFTWSEELFRIFGLEPTQPEPSITQCSQQIHPDDRPLWQKAAERALATGTPYELDVRIVRPDGQVRHVEIRGEPIFNEFAAVIRLFGTALDITERKQAELALTVATERLQHLLTSSPGAIYSCKVGGDYAATFISENVSAMLGYEARDFLEDSSFWVSHIHPEDKERFFTGAVQLFEEGHQSYEYRFLHKDGTYRWVYDQIRLIRDEAGNPIECVGYWVDISDRKQTELAFQESQRRYQTLADASPAGIFHTDVEGNCLYVNQRWSEITGLSVEEALGTVWTSAVHPDDSDRVTAEWHEAAAATGAHTRMPFKSEYRCVRPDGQITWVIGQALAEVGDDGEVKGFVATITDISDRKRVEEALRQSAERERAIAEVIQRMRQTLDINTIFSATTEELRHVINCDRVGIYRFNPDWSGEFVAESVANGWTPLVAKQKNDPELTKNAVEDENCLVKTLDSPDKLTVSSSRISTQAPKPKSEIQGASYSGEDLLKAAPQNLKSNVLVHDTYLQETQGGAYSQGASYLLVEDTYNAGFTACYIDLLERFQARAYITVPILCGSNLWGLLASYQNSGPRRWEAAEINIVVQIGSQLGVALQQAELLAQTQQQSAALQQAKEAADTANRAKSQFLANMSHELRTPLNAILGFTQVINRDASLSKQQREHLGIIMRSGEHLLELINDILEMSKIEAGRITFNESSFDLYRLLDSLQEMFQLKAKSKGLQLICDRTPEVPQFVRTDEGKLRQVLINLLSNAIKFTEEGSVTLRVFKELKVGRLKVEGLENNFQPADLQPANLQPVTLHFAVEDTGPGIAPKEIDSLFEAFTQTAAGRQSQQGTGLGLPISRSFVQLMGGDITVSSTLGQGATFKFDIQIKSAGASEIQTQQLTGRAIGIAPDQREYRILIVEDKWTNRLLLVKLLKAVGFQVREAENGQEAIALWSSWQPQLILMDMRMPVMDGYEATKQIKSHLKGQATVIIALTASAFEEQRAAILSAGCDDFIRKPFQEKVLLEKIAEHLGLHYVYEDSAQASWSQSGETIEVLTSEALAVMPKEWLAQIHLAAEACNDEEILALVEQIPQQHEALKSALADLVNDFRLDIIIDLSSP
jgi:PAS domain S-box-containing protein